MLTCRPTGRSDLAWYSDEFGRRSSRRGWEKASATSIRFFRSQTTANLNLRLPVLDAGSLAAFRCGRDTVATKRCALSLATIDPKIDLVQSEVYGVSRTAVPIRRTLQRQTDRSPRIVSRPNVAVGSNQLQRGWRTPKGAGLLEVAAVATRRKFSSCPFSRINVSWNTARQSASRVGSTMAHERPLGHGGCAVSIDLDDGGGQQMDDAGAARREERPFSIAALIGARPLRYPCSRSPRLRGESF